MSLNKGRPKKADQKSWGLRETRDPAIFGPVHRSVRKGCRSTLFHSFDLVDFLFNDRFGDTGGDLSHVLLYGTQNLFGKP